MQKKKNVEFYLESTTTILAMLLLRGRNGSRWLDWKARQKFGAKEKRRGKTTGKEKEGKERECMRNEREWERKADAREACVR